MTIFLTVLATAAIGFTAHMVYGFILVGREYDQSEQAWTNAREKVVPVRPQRLQPARPIRLQRA